MKTVALSDIDTLPGIRLKAGDTFRFRCHTGVACFNRCCRNLRLFLYPYDVIRLKNALGITADRFLDEYVDVVLREESSFPEVLLRMADNEQQTCPFLSDDGCRVYADRPDTCRFFPVERGLLFEAHRSNPAPVYFFRPPDFCLGQYEDQQWNVAGWARDQQAATYDRMTARWAQVKQLFQSDPWGSEGPSGQKARVAFMAAYNVDRFRQFIFESTFLQRFRVNPNLVRKIRTNDVEMMTFGWDWIRFFVFGISSKKIRPR
jgi:Fe-S-cluster containining protein